MKALAQLWALLGKSWAVRRVHWITSFFELICPLLFVLIISVSYNNLTSPARYRHNRHHHNNRYDSYGNLATNDDTNTNKRFNRLGPKFYEKPEETVEYNFRADFLVKHYSFARSFKSFYAPDNDITRRLMSGLIYESPFSLKPIVEPEGCANESELTSRLEDLSDHHYYFTQAAGIVFINADMENVKKGNLSYKIKMLTSKSDLQLTYQLFPMKHDQTPVHDYNTITYWPFVRYQAYINREYIKLVCELNNIWHCTDNYIRPINIYRAAYPEYHDPRSHFISIYDLLGMLLIISYLDFCPILVKRITDEKATKARELLRLIGMSDLMYWVSHFLNNFLVLLIHSVVITFLFTSMYSPMISYASSALIFTIVLLFGVQLILFSMTITTVFNRSVIAVIVTTMAWIIISAVISATLLPDFSMAKAHITSLNHWRRFACLLPMGSIIMFMAQLAEYENFAQELTFDNIGELSTFYGSFTALNTLFLQVASIPIYCFLIWYLDNVWPFQHGVPKPFYYLFQPSYWLPRMTSGATFKYSVWDESSNANPERFEAVLINETPSISLKNVTKTFTSGLGNSKTVIEKLNFDIFKNEITVLVGHNSAGKSTIMNMITGMFQPTSGNVYVNDFDVAVQTKRARQSISLCPQENIFFSELTVYQHLWLFAKLKGSPSWSIEDEIEKILKLLKLGPKKNEYALNLSGGQKRKLSLGIALIGNTDTLILDEPTSGMDPDARRSIWDVLLSIRREKTILLTTQYMEEADVLGDRIAIMNAGKLKCLGSPYFLKNLLGTGYRLRIAKLPGFQAENFLKTICQFIPTANLVSDVETEVMISLESELSKNELMGKFRDMFEYIEQNKEDLRVDSSGLSYSTLEDVFLSVGSDVEWNGLNEDRIENERLELSRAEELNSGVSLVISQLWALLLKRFHYSRRHWLMFTFQIVIPGLIMLLAFFTQNELITTFSDKETIDLELSTVGLYGKHSQSFYYGNDTFQEQFENIVKNREKGEIFYSGNGTRRDADNALLYKVDDNLANYIHHYLYGIGIYNKSHDIVVNFEQLHSIPIAVNVYFESILRTILNSDEPTIKVFSSPVLNPDYKDGLNLSGIAIPWIFISLIFLPIAFPFLASSYILFAIEENVSKSKLIQLMTKMSPAVFWAANFIFDMLSHLLATGVMFVIIWSMDWHNIVFGKTANNAAFALLVLMVVFGLSTIPIAYILSYKFTKPSSGFVFMVIAFFLFGFLFNIYFSFVELGRTYFEVDFMDGWYEGILAVIRIVPIFSFLFGYQKVYKMSCLSRLCDLFDENTLNTTCESGVMREIIQGCCPDCDPCYKDFNPLSIGPYGAGIEVIYMLFGGILSLYLIVVYEIYKIRIHNNWAKYAPRIFKCGSDSSDTSDVELIQSEDKDVERERARVEEEVETRQNSDIFSVLHLCKKFGKLTAVNDLTFGVRHGECFGLLGVNGAGKTTTFSMLTGDQIPTSGNAFISEGKYSLVDNLEEFQSRIGYCPQFDALLNRITGYETLALFARLRGIPENNLERDIRNLIKMVGLEKHAHKLVGAYSGGNKRKLSIAVALIGNPQVLFLDEPSAGIDPAARRKIWQTLGYLKRNFNCSIILTSHSMEECEALCSRLGIMVNGRFRCLGSSQHLRSLYGQGYSVTISIKKHLGENKDYIDKVNSEMQKTFPSAVMKDFHQGLMHYHITDPAERWSNIFTQMVQLSHTLEFDDYNVSDTTLEQIFLMFARHQKVEEAKLIDI